MDRMSFRVVLWVFGFLFLSGCSSIRVENVTQVDPKYIIDEIYVLEDQKTRDSVLPVIQEHLENKGYRISVVQSESDVVDQAYILSYRAWWSWDLATYMSRAHIKMKHDGNVIGNVTYEGKGGLNTNKWGVAERRLQILLDTLLNEISVTEANKQLQ